ncbi:MAG: hypothetical protein HOL70_07865, partial [Candidatus Marinimicrobia bacterium]|nr:hypothetical protein [Candidatus Neomarinimicrobiota bacterium]
RTSGSTDNDSPVQIIQSPSSTDVVVLSNYRATDTQTNVIMMEKYNLDGDRLWAQFYDGSTYLIPTAVTLTDDNGYYILFYTFSTVTGFQHLGLIKTDENGNEIWRQIYVFDDYDSPRDIIRSNGELVILFEGALGVSVMGLDLEGQVLWTKYQSSFTDAARIIATSDSGFAVVGRVGDGDRDAYLLKLDSDGEEEWHQIYGGDLHQDGNDIVQLADESFVFCGYSQVQASMDYAGWLYKVDSSGETVWERSFPTVGHKIFRAMCQTNDGGFLITGDIPFLNGSQTIILKTSSLGSSEWETGGLFPSTNWGIDLIETADRGVIAVGSVAIDVGYNDHDIWIARFEGELDIIPPDVRLNNPDITEAIHIGDTLAVTWTASDNFALDWAKLFFSSNGGSSFNLYDSVDANLGGLEWVAPDVISNSCNFAIWVSDISGNVSADTLSESFAIIDATSPLISILSPTQTTSIREHDSLFIAWIASDNIGIDWFELWYSNKPSDPFESLGQISGDDTTFAFAFGIGAGVSDSARIKMDVMDVAGNLAEDYSEYFSIIDNTSPVISYFSIPDTIEWGIGSIMDIGVIATDNVEITGLDLNYSTDNGSNWLPIVDDLYPVQGRPTHSWLIPDIPGDCQIQAIVIDAVGLTDTSYSDIFSIFVEYPRMVASLPEIRPDGDMHLRFSQIMDSLDIASGTQVIGSVHGAYEIDGSLNGYELTISSSEGFVSLDTIMIVLTS